MISRRLLRIKALTVLYASERKEVDDLDAAEQELLLSIRRSYDLFQYVFLLFIALSDLAREKVALSAMKRVPGPEDINPSTRFAENRIIERFRNNRQLRDYALATPALWSRKDKLNSVRSLARWLATRGLSWDEKSQVVKQIFNDMVRWEGYTSYMNSAEDSFKSDQRFIREFATRFLPLSEEFAVGMEEESVYWNDDLPFIIPIVKKTISRFKEGDDGSNTSMPALYGGSESDRFVNDEDLLYVKELLRRTILNSDKNSRLIDDHTTNWEVERIALMDKFVMQLAVTELTEFAEIPVKVTLNEYIEISKEYCTAKSSIFVNGILDKIVRELRDTGGIVKKGRGLIGEEI